MIRGNKTLEVEMKTPPPNEQSEKPGQSMVDPELQENEWDLYLIGNRDFG